jgi:hypothetical protein
MLEQRYSESEEGIYLRFLEEKFENLGKTYKSSEFWRKYSTMEKSISNHFEKVSEEGKLCLENISKKLEKMVGEYIFK